MTDDILTFACPGRMGIAAAVCIFLSERHCNTLGNARFRDGDTFFSSCVWLQRRAGAPDENALQQELASVVGKFFMHWDLARARVVRCHVERRVVVNSDKAFIPHWPSVPMGNFGAGLSLKKRPKCATIVLCTARQAVRGGLCCT